ncbi:MAG: HEAT repeat domain-containing protein [Sedimentisphaerales bacterium]|nr:HEAT repeat domain-containing protein [Sedimentisphaerales bacterium]
MKVTYLICKTVTLLILCSCVVYSGAAEPAQDDAIGIVLEILKGSDQEMQAVAISMVKDMAGKDVTEALAKELPNLSARSQVMLLSALSDRGDAAALPAVNAAAKAEDPSVRVAALRALGQLGDASSVELLAHAAATTTGEERKAACDSLYRLRGADVDQTIIAAIPEAEPKVKVELIDAVGERNIRQGVSILLGTAKDSDRKVRIQSLRVLKVVAGPADMPALVDLLVNAQSSSDRNEAQKTVAAVAHKIEDENRQAEAVLAVLPKVKSVDGRCSLLGVLGKIGDNTALPVLMAALKDENAEVQTAAIRALSEWPSPEPINDLLKVAEGSENKVHRILALRGFVRLLGLESKRSAEELLEMYKKAMNLAPDVGEKQRVLSGLGNVKSPAALKIAVSYLDDKALSKEASSAAVKIASGICDDFPKEAAEALKKIIAQTKETDPLRGQAQEVIDKIGQP